MQGLSDHVNMGRDRGRRSRWRTIGHGLPAGAGCEPARAAAACLVGALPVVILGDHGGHAVAIIAVGLAVAAADGTEYLVADFRHFHAGAGCIDDVALSGLPLTEQPSVALNADDGAALLAGAHRIGA